MITYKIKVGDKWLVGENYVQTIKGTYGGDTRAVFSRNCPELSAYDFTDDEGKASLHDRVTAAGYIDGLMVRQSYGLYLGDIVLMSFAK